MILAIKHRNFKSPFLAMQVGEIHGTHGFVSHVCRLWKSAGIPGHRRHHGLFP